MSTQNFLGFAGGSLLALSVTHGPGALAVVAIALIVAGFTRAEP